MTDLPQPKFGIGASVRKKSGSAWSGTICGTYSTSLTPEGYAVESDAHPGSVQIYPAAALELTLAHEARERTQRQTSSSDERRPEDAPICPWCDQQGWDTCGSYYDTYTCERSPKL